MNALALASALNKTGFGENLQVVGNRGWGDASEGDEFAADYLSVGGDGFENLQAGGVGQSL